MQVTSRPVQRSGQRLWITATVVAAIGLGLAIGSDNRTVLIGSLGLMTVATIVVRPFLGLCILVLMVPLEEGLLLTRDVTALKLVGALVFVGWFAQWAHRPAIVPRPLLMAFLLFGLWGLVSFVWADSSLAAIYRWTSMLQMIAFAFLIVQLAGSTRRLLVLVASNLVGAFVAAGLALHAYLTYGASDPALRVSAFVGGGSVDAQNADNYPILLSLGAAFCLVRAVTSGGLARLPWALGATMLTLAALLSGTRSFVAAFGVAVLVFALLLGRERRVASKAPLILVVAVVTVGAVVTLPSHIVARISTTPSALFNSADQGSGRVDIWKVYLRMIADNPVVGVGIGNAPSIYPRYANPAGGGFMTYVVSSSETAFERDPHSDIIMVLAELGVIGLGLFVLFVGGAASELARALRSVSHRSRLWPLGVTTAMYLTTVLIAGLVDPKVTKKVWWLAVGLSLAFARLARQEAAALATDEDRDLS